MIKEALSPTLNVNNAHAEPSWISNRASLDKHGGDCIGLRTKENTQNASRDASIAHLQRPFEVLTSSWQNQGFNRNTVFINEIPLLS
jgi:hypothetical protein